MRTAPYLRAVATTLALVLSTPNALAAPPVPDEETIIIEDPDADPPDPASLAPAERVTADVTALLEGDATDSEATILGLRQALSRVEAHPFEIADDPSAHRIRVKALLRLAELLVQQGDEEAAAASIDEAIRVVRGDPLPAGIDPKLEQLVFERLSDPRNAHRGSLHVRCKVPCRVVLDEREVGRGSEISARGIPLGRHRLRIRALSTPDATESAAVLLTADAPKHDAIFEGPPKPVIPIADPTDTPQLKRRALVATSEAWKMPRWTSIAGLAVGSALLASGALLLAFDGRCPDLTDPKLEPHCQSVLDTKWAGVGLAAGGGAMMVAFSITLGLGDARQRASTREKQTARRWTPRWGHPAMSF